MALYNVFVGVVDLVHANNEKEAIAWLRDKLTQAGFDVHDDVVDYGGPHAFLSEEQPSNVCEHSGTRIHKFDRTGHCVFCKQAMA